MKEFMNNFKEAIKKGIILWVIAHLVLYAIGAYNNDLSLYDAQIDKLHDPINFVLQLAFAGLLYSALEVTFAFFVDNVLKYSAKGDSKKAVVNAIVALIIMGFVCLSAYAMKKTDIVNKNIVKIMIVLVMIKGGAGIVSTVKDNTVYNTKLHEKNNE